ncbi:ArsR/SmtB family transcription factor [Micromonospora sp. NPDC004704]
MSASEEADGTVEPGGTVEPESSVRLDGRQIRALAHPVRSRLLAALRSDGPATATGLANALGTNTGNTSYHLRQLAEVGLVAEDTGRGTGRERWWRSVHRSTIWFSSDFDDDPDARAASDWFDDHLLHSYVEQARNWNAAKRGYPAEWRAVGGYHDSLLSLTPERLGELTEELGAVIRRYMADPSPVGDQTEQVLLYLNMFPRVDTPPGAPSDSPTAIPPGGLPIAGHDDEERP